MFELKWKTCVQCACAYTRVYHVHLYFHNILRKVSYYKFIVICVRMHFVCELSRVFYGIYIILLLLLLFLLWIFHEFIWFCEFACVIWSHLLAENKCSVILHRSQAVTVCEREISTCDALFAMLNIVWHVRLALVLENM